MIIWSHSGVNYGSILIPAVFWSQILMVLSWEDVATWAAPPGGAGRNTQEAVVWRWPLYSTTLQPGWRRSQSWPKQTDRHKHTQSQEPCLSEEHASTAELVGEFYRTQRVQELEGNESVVIGGQRWVSHTKGKDLLFKIVNVDTQYLKEQLKMQLNVDFFWRDLQNKIQF